MSKLSLNDIRLKEFGSNGSMPGESLPRILPPSAHFNDGKRVIDFILGFHPDHGGKRKQEFSQIRRKFEQALKTQANPFSLQEEYRIDQQEYFTDAFARSRMDEFLIKDKNTFFTEAQRIYLTWSIITNTSISWEVKKKKKKGLGGLGLTNGVSNEPQTKNANIQVLLRDSYYTTAFPIHDGEFGVDEDMDYSGYGVAQWPLRKYLYESWAKFSQWKRYQPLDQIRDYYGERVGIYFAWLGFYTKMLILPAILGVIVFVFGFITLVTDPSIAQICEQNSTQSQTLICRGCKSPLCEYTELGHYCTHFKMSRVFDNAGSTFYSIFMAIWAIVFLEFWKRYQSELCARWDVSAAEYSDDVVRPDFEIGINTRKLNPITKKEEPYLEPTKRMKKLLVSCLVVSCFLVVVFGLLASILIYKIVGKFYWTSVLRDKKTGLLTFDPNLMVSLTASVVNGIFIGVMNKIYTWVAWKLTMAEMPRTQVEFEESYTYKVFLFQFFNFYGALFYLSFVRGQFVDPPDEQALFRSRCPPSGCIMDVTIQLAVIMVGKQAINNILEIGLPLFKNWVKGKFRKKATEDNSYTRWEKDHDLEGPPAIIQFEDYLEMLIQYGFVTMFVPAFPLAPLFALLNNILEIRVDAFKTLTQTRRYIPMRAKDIGPWFNLLGIVSRIAVLTNAFLIAFTTDFIDRKVYEIMYQGLGEFEVHQNFLGQGSNHSGTEGKATLGYVEFILTKFNTDDWCHETPLKKIPTNQTEILSAVIRESECGKLKGGIAVLVKLSTIYCTLQAEVRCKRVIRVSVDICYFRDYRLRNEETGDYDVSAVWWHVLVAKLAFIVLFEHLVLLIQALLGYLIPDVPEHVSIRLQRESYLQKQSFMKGEMGDALDDVEEISDINSEADSDDLTNVDSFVATLPPETTVSQQQTRKAKREAEKPKTGLFKFKNPFAKA